jgi:serine/threonine protein kinase
LAQIVNVEVSHPALVAPLAAGLESGTPYMAYEYVEGESLDVALRREIRPSQTLQWIELLAGAVDAAHARGLEHGALHLRDILVSSEGVCATGFGIARALEHVQLDIPVRRPYTAQEMTAGRRWGPPADRFAVAVVAYELLTGTRPAGDSDEAIADLHELCPGVADPAGLQQAFRNALADDPGIRSASATAFAKAVAGAVGEEAVAGVPSMGRELPAGEPDLFDDILDAPDAGAGETGPTDDESAFGGLESPDPAEDPFVGSGEGPSHPVQIVLPEDAAPEPTLAEEATDAAATPVDETETSDSDADAETDDSADEPADDAEDSEEEAEASGG